jgi:hypothetical protein
MEAREVTKEELSNNFPTTEVLEKWYRGEDADWPPFEEPEFPELRFDVGTRVLCRIGPDANKDWAPGEIVLLWYREPNWPKGCKYQKQTKQKTKRRISPYYVMIN